MHEPNPQSIGSGSLQDEGNPDAQRREVEAEREFARAAEPDKAKRKADAPDDPGDMGRGENASRRNDAREDSAARP